MRKARLGLQSLERDAERLRTLLNLGLDVLMDDLGGVDFTTSITGSWQDTGLALAVTSTRAVAALSFLQAVTWHSVALAYVAYRIVYDSTTVIANLWNELTPNATRAIPFTLIGTTVLNANTTYTFKVQALTNTAGTLTLYGNAAYTRFTVILAHKAALT